jgi:serine/threonine-protein kinase ULK4
MENYNIYDEVGRGTHSFVYKARRKRSIEYVAVKSTVKCRMDKVRGARGWRMRVVARPED